LCVFWYQRETNVANATHNVTSQNIFVQQRHPTAENKLGSSWTFCVARSGNLIRANQRTAF
jgi:hypothetical protein